LEATSVRTQYSRKLWFFGRFLPIRYADEEYLN
jgi:hypothetical protein